MGLKLHSLHNVQYALHTPRSKRGHQSEEKVHE
jgi:hypothetical protein